MQSNLSTKSLLRMFKALSPVITGLFGLFGTAGFAADVTSTWNTATSGNWNVNANWTNVPALGGFPNNGSSGVATYDATISPTGSPYTVTLNTDVALEDLLLNSVNATVSHTSGTLTATGALNLTAGTFSLAGGTISNSTVNATVPITLTNASNILSGVTVNGDLNFLPVFHSQGLITGGTTFSNAHLAGFFSEISFAPAQSLTGTIQFEGSGNSTVDLSASGSLTVGSSGVIKTVAGLAADVTVGGGGGSFFVFNGAMALINNGLISSQVSGRTLTINPATSFANGATGTLDAKSGSILTIAPVGTWTNAGTISVNAATVNLGGTFNATGGIGTWSNTAGTVNVTGTINAGSGANTLALNNTTGSWNLAGGTINGGTLAVADGKTLNATNTGGTLSGVTVNGDLSFPAVFNAKVLIAGGTTFATAHLAGNYSAIGFAPAQTLTGTIQFEGAGDQASVTMGSAGTFTVGATGVIKTLAGLTGNVTVGSGAFAYNADMALINNGLISSQVSGRTLTINPATSFANGATGTLEAKSGSILTIAPVGTWTNAGTISVNAATVNLGGTFNATGGIGTWSNTAGTVNVTGTITNTGNTLTLSNSTGSWNLAGGTINGGTLAFAGGKSLNLTNADGTLSGVTVNGDLGFPSVFNAKVLIAGGTTFNTAHLAGNYSAIGFAPAQTLSGTIQFEGAGDLASVTLSSAGNFTVGASGMIKTVAGLTGNVTVGNGGFAYNGAMALTNNGLISSQVSGRTLTINPATSFANGGTLEATNGGNLAVPLGYTQTAGITRLSGGGTISAVDPVILNKLNTITIAGGRLEGNGTIMANVANSGTLAVSPGVAAGQLAVASDLTLASSSTLQIEIGGAIQGSNYDFITEAGTTPLNLSGALSVTLTNGFLPGNADSFIVLASNQPITGNFSNVVNGRVLTTDGVNSLGVSVIGNVVVLAKLPGDYNGNGIVDAADYTVWRDGLGVRFTQPYYDVWKANFGKTAGSGSSAGANAAVPEPTTLVLSMFAVVGWCLQRTRAA